MVFTEVARVRLVAQQLTSSQGDKLITEPWWDNFVRHSISDSMFWTNYSAEQHKQMLKDRLKAYGAELKETQFGTVLDFNSAADATAFVLMWS